MISLHDTKSWQHLHDIDLRVMGCKVELLIGANVSKAMEHWNFISSVDNGHFIVKILLEQVSNQLLDLFLNDENNYACVYVNSTDATKLKEQIRNQFNYNFSEKTIDDIYDPCRDDKKFLDLVSIKFV